MWEKIKKIFNKSDPLYVPIHKGNVLLITAVLNKGTVAVSYKGQVKTGYFGDSILKKMTKPTQYRFKAIEDFCGGVAKLILSLSDEKKANELNNN